MLKNQGKTYDFSYNSIATVPKRSTLYKLKPVGIGTPNVESLTSYLTRLASAHNVSLGVLVEKLGEHTKEYIHYQSKLSSYNGFESYINGSGLISEYFVDSVETLTQHININYLTILSWRGVLPFDYKRDTKAWCPLCFNEMKYNKNTFYEPLLWYIKFINECPKHKVKLVEKCPSCEKKNNYLKRNLTIGKCQHCNEDLGLKQVTSCDYVTKEEKNRQDWIQQEFCRLLATGPIMTHFPTSNSIIYAISNLIERTSEGNHTAFANKVNISRTQISSWLRRKEFPSIESLLNISYYLNVPLVDLLTNNTESLEVKLRKKGSYTPRQIKTIDYDKAYNLLKDSLNQYPPPSLSELLRKLNCSYAVARNRIDKELCRKIGDRHKDYKKIMKAERIERVCNEIREVTITLYEKGVYPSQRNIRPHLSEYGYFFIKEARDTWRKVREELGIKVK